MGAPQPTASRQAPRGGPENSGAALRFLETLRGLLVLLALLGCVVRSPAAEPASVALPAVALTADELALVVNDADPYSVEVGAYYAQRRGIPAERVLHVRLPADRSAITAAEFAPIQAQLDARMPATVQAYALAWARPYRVDCMSITSAVAFGFDKSHCADSCQLTARSPYYDSDSRAPFTDHHLRPAMLLAAADVAGAKALIDRGVRSDERWPAGEGVLLSTGDKLRNVRAASHAKVLSLLGAAYPLHELKADRVTDRGELMFYFTGLEWVAGLAHNRFADGAMADHLTSAGGMLTDSPQMSALAWIAAGATGSYGAVTEPCNFRAKFPEPGIVMARYLGGESLVEAYWKSVLMPGQGVFVGDPLARPFGGVRINRSAAGTLFSTRALPPGDYLLEAGNSSVGPFRPVRTIRMIGFGVRLLPLPAGDDRWFRLRAIGPPSASSAASAAASAGSAASTGG